MLSLSKIFTKQPLNLISECLKVTSQRSIYTANFFGLNGFKSYVERVEKEQGRNLESLKMTIEQSLSKPDSKIFTEDLKNLLYLTKNDTDLDLLLRALKRYQSQESLAIFNFNFEVPLVKLLTQLNKTDKALEIFGTKGDINFTKLHKPRMVLMNKLLEDKRYNDVLQLAKVDLESIKTPSNEGENVYPSLVLSNLVSHAALELNTPEALNQAKEVFRKITSSNLLFNSKGVVAIFLLALQQNDLEFAFEVSNALKQNKNLKIIAYSRLNRVDEALNEAMNLLNETDARGRKQYFNSLTLEELKNAVEKSGNDTKKKQLEDLNAQIGDRLNKLNLREYAVEPIDKRPNQNKFGNNQNRQSNDNDSNSRNRNVSNENRDDGRRFNRNDNNNNNNQRNFQRGDGFRRNYDNNQNNNNNNNRYNRSNNQRVSSRNENNE